MKNYLKNYISTSSFIIIGYLFISHNSFYKGIINSDVTFINTKLNISDIFLYILFFYLILLIPFYFFENGVSKARIVINTIIKKFKNINYQISDQEKVSILSWLVKLFFLPLMITWLIQNGTNMSNNLFSLWDNKSGLLNNFTTFFNNHLFFSIYWTIMFLDVLVFSIGYSIESKYLGNVIKSVEPTFLGWAVALLCYPPFNGSTGNILGWYSETFASIGLPIIQIILNLIILISFMIYLSASFTLGFKASNLTNRGIVTKGPYKIVRHPAYIAKNLARTIGTIPALIIAFKDLDIAKLLLIIFSTIGRFFLYYMRAITEEKHLGQDPEYINYKKKVRYRFIPKIF